MPFTGRIGTDLSQLGNVVLGIVDSFELSAIGFKSHVLSSTEIRLRFDRAVTSSALTISAYMLSAITAGAYVPSIASVAFYDSDQTSVIIKLSNRLSWTKTYSIQVNGIVDFTGQGVTGIASSFVANVQDPPRAIGAYLGRRGTVDVVFDRDVGAYSGAATASIQDTGHSQPAVPMPQLDWSSENIPTNVVRFVLSSGMHTANAFEIQYVNISDVAANLATGSASLTLILRGSPPYDAPSINQIQFTDALVMSVAPFINVATIRVFFNLPIDPSQAVDTTRWTIEQTGPHLVADTVHGITVSDANSLPTVITLLNSAKSMYNAHVAQSVSHLILDSAFTVTVADATDFDSSVTLWHALVSAYGLHTLRTGVHLYNENILQPSGSASDLAHLILAANNFKSTYNQHISSTRFVSFTNSLPAEIGQISNFASSSTKVQEESPLRYFVDLHVTSHTIAAGFRVRATLQSEDGGSTTSTLNFTGDITARPAASAAIPQYYQVIADTGVNLYCDREISLSNIDRLRIELPLHNSDDAWNSVGTVYSPAAQFRLTSTLKDVAVAINELIFAYTVHIGPNGAGHVTPEVTYGINHDDYLLSHDLDSMIEVANRFRVKYNLHATSTVHSYPDAVVDVEDAYDFDSLVALIDALRRALDSHNLSGYEPYGSVRPRFPGHHSHPGWPVMVFNLWTAVSSTFSLMRDSAVHKIQGVLQHVRFDPASLAYDSHPFTIDVPFLGVAYRPCLASALPAPGLITDEDFQGNVQQRLQADSFEMYFSRPMDMIQLDGGDYIRIYDIREPPILSISHFFWKNSRTVLATVSGMENIQYTVIAVNMTDEAGNPVY